MLGCRFSDRVAVGNRPSREAEGQPCSSAEAPTHPPSAAMFALRSEEAGKNRTLPEETASTKASIGLLGLPRLRFRDPTGPKEPSRIVPK
jgi:hypothetical protein